MLCAKPFELKQSEMSSPITIYKFAEFTLHPAKRILLRNGEEIPLVSRDFEILYLLIEERQHILSKDRIIKSVWGDVFVADSSVEKAISALRKTLGDTPTNSRFIKTVSKKGYKFVHGVDEITENKAIPHFEQPVLQTSSNRHSVFIIAAGLLYGLLFWVALLLEIAYRFDRFGTTAVWLGLPLVLWIAAANFAGLTLTEKLVRREKRHSFFVGLAFFVGGTIAACLAMSYFLPNEPITAANFQTQPAFAAFLKNSLIYFLPLGVVYMLIPFHFVCVQQNEMQKTSPISGKTAINLHPSFLFGLWLFSAVYSILTTFHLLDNLLPGQFHNLFVSLVFLRFFIYFSLGLICLLWYKSQRLPIMLAVRA